MTAVIAVTAVLVVVGACVGGPGPTTGTGPDPSGSPTSPTMSVVNEPSTSVPTSTEAPPVPTWTVLLYSRTTGFRHESLPDATDALRDELLRRGAVVRISDDPADLDRSVRGPGRAAAVVFLLTTGDVVDPGSRSRIEDFVRGGGGFVGVHSALDTEYGWPFYGDLIGAWFAGHPPVQEATVLPAGVPATGWPGTGPLPTPWVRTDEWYDVRADPGTVARVLASVDESTYTGGAMGAAHPVEWCRDLGAGRSYVTSMGHTVESWKDPTFVGHVGDAVEWAATPDARCR